MPHPIPDPPGHKTFELRVALERQERLAREGPEALEKGRRGDGRGEFGPDESQWARD